MCLVLFVLWVQLVIGFLLRERPVFALATVATVVVKQKFPILEQCWFYIYRYLMLKTHTGNLDCVSLCCSCFNGDIPLLATPLLYLVLLKLCSTRRFNRSYQFCKPGKFQIFFLLNYILDGSYSHCWITILACSLHFLFSVLIILWVNFTLVNNVKVIHIL